ncbi:MAG: hypothetical protein C0404_00860 [Verrucomicrobia bacterium]|nr:hypothetical protein [Verrucomicrobiota bacterium]
MSEDKIVYGERLEHSIYFIRGHRVMLSTDLARLYEVESKVLIQAVKRNVKRFPADFMFVLESQDVACLRSQIVTLDNGQNRRRGRYSKYPSYAL